MLKKICAQCGKIINYNGGGMCEACLKRYKHRGGEKRDPKIKEFRNSQSWLNKREHILARDNYCCQICKQEGRIVPATDVHHIVYLSQDFSKRLDDDNLVSLCKQHHKMVHGRGYKKVLAIHREPRGPYSV